MKERPKKQKAEKPGCPMWMMTFGDAMSLLVTFFVMLIAFSSMEDQKLAAMMGVLRGALGAADLMRQGGAIELHTTTDRDHHVDAEIDHTIRGEDAELRFLTAEEMADVMPDFVDRIRDQSTDSIPDRVLIHMLDGGISIVMQTASLFEPGGDTFTRDFSSVWQGIAWLLIGRDNELRITSITGTGAPVRREVAATAWGLGIARANLIAHQLQVAIGAPPERFGVGVEVRNPRPDGSAPDHMEIMIMQDDYLLDLGSEEDWPLEVWR